MPVLGLQLDGAVQVQVPVEPVVVVADGQEERDDESSRPPHLGHPVEHVGVLPQHAVVLLVQADRVLHHLRVTVLVGDGDVEVRDLAQAIAAQLKGIGVPAEQVLTLVEVVLPVPHRRRVGVGHHHLGDGRAVHHGRPAMDSWCRVRPSRTSNPNRNFQSAQLIWLPSTVKLAPSGWMISMGLRSVRGGTACGSASHWPRSAAAVVRSRRSPW